MTETTITKTIYSDEDIERGLQALALHGSAWKAEKQMPNPIPRNTLEKWKTSHAARYHEIRNNTLAETRARLAAEYEDLALQATEASRLAIRATVQELKAGKSKSPHDAAAKLAQTAGTMTDKANLLRGHATQIITTINATDLLAELARQLPNAQADTETTAQEITPDA